MKNLFEELKDETSHLQEDLKNNTPPKNLRHVFSKQLAPELRQETARRLREARKIPKTYKEIKSFSGEFSTDPKIEKTAQEMRWKVIDKWFNTWEYKQLKADLEKRLKSEKEWHTRSAKLNFEKKFEEILRQSPLTAEEQVKYLSESAMMAMSLEDYLIILKRLSGNFVSHVTRYGVREQTFIYHSAGKGEFFSSFTDILKEKKLHSFFTNFTENPNAFPIVREYIEHCIKDNGLRGEVLVQHLLGFYSTGNMPADRDSIHVAVNNIASVNYGSEKGYDFYFYFPAEFVAYNYYHHGRQEKEFQYREQTGYDSYNDMGIWNEGKGIPIDAGITCIREDALVDRETGSQYKIVDGKPVLDETGKSFLPAESPITSKEFWEKYFVKHPEQKPSKIIYYRGMEFRVFGIGPEYEELYKKKRFGTIKDLPQYEKHKKEILGRFEEKIRELVASMERGL